MRAYVIIFLLAMFHFNKSHQTRRKQESFGPSSLNDEESCEEKSEDCAECLSEEGQCSWCVEQTRSVCRKLESCPEQNRSKNCRLMDDESEGKVNRWKAYDPSLDELQAMDQPSTASNNSVNITGPNNTVVTTSASALCSSQSGACSNCTAFEFCFWCETTGSCDVYINESTVRNSCSENLMAYHKQCLYPIGIFPCELREKHCENCLKKDHLCYWCSQTETCGFYPGGDFQPEGCASDRWYHDGCPMVEDLLWVLLPILAIILIPVVLYIIIWLICWCARAAGYEPLQPVGGEPGMRKHPKGIRLRPGSPTNRTEKLREKYGLGSP